MAYRDDLFSVRPATSGRFVCAAFLFVLLAVSGCGDGISSDDRTRKSTAVRSSQLGGGANLFRESARLVASDPDASSNDAYAQSLAVDHRTAIVSARFANRDVDGDGSEESDAGAAYVFEYSGGLWEVREILTASDGEQEQQFGTAVALDGDTAIIGTGDDSRDVNGDNVDESSVGAAYVFVRSQGTWKQQEKLTASDAESEERFGDSVAITADTVLVGAPREKRDFDGDGDVEIEVGAAYVFSRNNGVWTEQTKLTATNPEESGRFGKVVAVDSDTALVGSILADWDIDGDGNDESDVGTAHVFDRSQGSWSRQEVLYAADGAPGQSFTSGIALDSDVALIGAKRDERDIDGDGSDERNLGAAYVFSRGSSGWGEQQKLISPSPNENAFFGSVALAGDVAIVGAMGQRPGGLEQAGSAFVFTRSNGMWSHRQTLAPAGLEDEDRFGDSVAMAGDSALVAAPFTDRDIDFDNAEESGVGAAYVYTADRDGDGISDSNDICPDRADPNQTDTDGDGVGDACDRCPEDANKTEPGECGCGTEETDSDGDGTADCVDRCPMDEDKIEPGVCGCGAEETDQDNDGTPDCRDQCPSNPDKTHPGACGCSRSDEDSDGDGLPDCFDACPNEEGPSGGDGCPANPDTGLDSDDATGDTGTGRGDDRQGEDGNCSTVGDGSIPGRLPLFGVLAVAVALRRRD